MEASEQYRLLMADVLEFARRSDLPQADLSQLLGLERDRRDSEPSAPGDRLHTALMNGDAAGVRPRATAQEDRRLWI